jgi:CheY-like chemotaxis protein
MAQATGNARRRVLLVEDDADSAEALLLVLERAGYEAATVDTARDALARLRGPRRPDVVLLDLTLRDLSGDALVSAFLEAGPLPPTVVISAATERALRSAAERLHARGALRKPFATEAFLLAIAEAAGSGDVKGLGAPDRSGALLGAASPAVRKP